MSSSISIHAPREGGDLLDAVQQRGGLFISIHAPREGGDARGGYTNIWMHISIHAPREGGRQQRCTVLPADL